MKITIYELLGLIKDGKAPKKIKEPQSSYTETYVFNEKEQWYITEDDTTKMNIWNKERLSSEVEIIEEVEDKEYEDIEEGKEIELYKTYQDYLENEFTITMANIISDIEAIFNENNDKINTLIRNQKYILEQLNK